MLVPISKSLQNALEKLSGETGEPISHLISSALSRCYGVPQHTLFQVSTSGALVQGIYERAVSRQVLISNGQQTLGVALPWAIVATLVRPSEKVLSISGDGGFLFSAMELETAVRLQSHLVHMIWIDGTYDMVAVQEEQKYGRRSGTEFGQVDPVKYAEAFGARGFMIQSPTQITSVLKQAFDTPGPVLVGIHVDYRDNHKLFEQVNERSVH